MAWDRKIPPVIHKTRWMNKSPDGVYQELKEYGDYYLENGYLYHDQDLELALLTRPDRLIHLGLAQYGVSDKACQALYKDACSPGGDPDYKKAIRLAVLGNPRLPLRDFTSDPGFGALTAEQLAQIVKLGDSYEIDAMLSNPTAKALLSRLFNRKEPFKDIAIDRYLMFLHYCSSNPALVDQDDSPDGPDMIAWDLQKGLLNLVKTLPVTADSLDALYRLLININPSHASNPDEDPRPMFERWRKLEGEKVNQPHDHLSHTSLGYRDEFVCLIASLYGQVYTDKKFTVAGRLNDSDQVMRCCYYGHTTLKGKELQQAYDRDKDVFIFATMQNISLPSTPEVRALVEKEMSGRETIKLYYKRIKQSQERWGGEVTAATEWGADLMEDLLPKPSKEQLRIQALEKQIDAVSKQVKAVSSLAQWSLIGVVVLLVIVLRRWVF